MAGGSPEHSLIIANVIGEVRNGLKGKSCRVYDSNLRVRIQRRAIYTYPNATIICGPVEFGEDDPRQQTALNPRVIIEVLSPNTEAYDRGKLERYREIDDFEEYVLV
jgi:Uma2 family endonuclease